MGAFPFLSPTHFSFCFINIVHNFILSVSFLDLLCSSTFANNFQKTTAENIVNSRWTKHLT